MAENVIPHKKFFLGIDNPNYVHLSLEDIFTLRKKSLNQINLNDCYIFFDEIQEEEAKCLGATLQLTKACLFWSNKRNLTYDEIALKFNSSTEMVRYRMHITGIAKRKNKQSFPNRAYH